MKNTFSQRKKTLVKSRVADSGEWSLSIPNMWVPRDWANNNWDSLWGIYNKKGIHKSALFLFYNWLNTLILLSNQFLKKIFVFV